MHERQGFAGFLVLSPGSGLSEVFLVGLLAQHPDNMVCDKVK